MATTTVHPSIPLALDLSAALTSGDDDRVVAALKPILADRITTTDVLLTLAAMRS